MTSIATTVRTHRLSVALVGAVTVLVLAAVALLLVTTGPAHGVHHLVTSSHVVPQFVKALFGGHLGS
jgi:hypothetical protein